MNKYVNDLRLTVRNGLRYVPLMQNLVSRELKKKYRRSILGYAWTILNPLLVMMILNVVFSTMFHNSIQNFPVYLFTGRMIYSFITDSTNGVSRSIISNSGLMRKTRVPNYIFPLSNFLSSIVNFGFTMIAFVILLVFTRTAVTVHLIAFPMVCAELFMFCFGLGLFLAQANVRVRDVGYIYSVFCTGWMYLTPLFYPLTALPENMQYLISTFNPAFYYVEQTRQIFLYNMWPTPELIGRGFLAGALFLALGLFAYARTKDDLILYI